MIRRMALAAGLLVLLPQVVSAQLADRKVLTLAVAKELAAAARAEAMKNQWKVVISIVDEQGIVTYLERMDNVQTASVEVSMAKARSAAIYRRPTKAFADRVTEGAAGVIGMPGVIAIEGGVPILVNGQVIGGIGVSGVTAQQDGVVAQAGADAAKLLK